MCPLEAGGRLKKKKKNAVHLGMGMASQMRPVPFGSPAMGIEGEESLLSPFLL